MVVKKEESENIVFDYRPREFPIVLSEPASDFVSHQETVGSDFKISELIAQQSGMSELQKKKIEAAVEEKALERLKEIEEKAYKEAYDLGLIEGTEKAFQERKAEFEERLNKIDELLATFENIKTKVLKENEAYFIKLLYAIAKKIALKEVEENQEVISEILDQLIEDVQSSDRIVLHMNDRDAQFIQELWSKQDGREEILSKLKIESSEKITAGGCLLETNFGTIDATVEQRVEKVWEALALRKPKLKDHNLDLQTQDNVASDSSESKDQSDAAVDEDKNTSDDSDSGNEGKS